MTQKSECERNCVLSLPLQLGPGSNSGSVLVLAIWRPHYTELNEGRGEKKRGEMCQGRGNSAK